MRAGRGHARQATCSRRLRRGRPSALQAPQPNGRAAVARLGACHARHVRVHGGAASPASAAHLGWLAPCTCSGPPTGIFQVLSSGFPAASCTTSQTGVQDVATSGGQHSPVHYHPNTVQRLHGLALPRRLQHGTTCGKRLPTCTTHRALACMLCRGGMPAVHQQRDSLAMIKSTDVPVFRLCVCCVDWHRCATAGCCTWWQQQAADSPLCRRRCCAQLIGCQCMAGHGLSMDASAH